jgi:hypothetical protein
MKIGIDFARGATNRDIGAQAIVFGSKAISAFNASLPDRERSAVAG